MQNKTDKRTLLVSKSLPVANLNSVNHLFSATKTNDYVLSNARLLVSGYPMRLLSLLGRGCIWHCSTRAGDSR